MKLCKIIITILALVTTLVGSAQNLTIEWSAESAHLVTRGGYARIKRVDNHHALVYETRGAVWIRFSHDNCESWSEPTEVARGEGYNYANSELLQLQSGRLLFMWNARPRRDTALPYKIMCATSDDGGASWSDGLSEAIQRHPRDRPHRGAPAGTRILHHCHCSEPRLLLSEERDLLSLAGRPDACRHQTIPIRGRTDAANAISPDRRQDLSRTVV